MSVATLRKEAKELGIPFSELRGLTTEEEIQAVIDGHSGKPQKKTAVKKKAVAKKKATAKKNSSRKQERKETVAKKKTSTKKATSKKTSKRVSEGGRNLLNGVDFTVTEGWNAREGSAPDRILRALRKHKGNRSKVFEALKSDLWDFIGRKNAKGEKRSKAEAEWQLRYRISRTAWDFAKRTGQHEPSQNRQVYGEGGTGVGVSGGMPVALRPDGWGEPVYGKKTKASRKTTTARKSAKKSTGKRGATPRKTGAKRKATARGRK